MLAVPFSAHFEGTQHQAGPDANDLVTVTISGTLSGNQNARLTIVLRGQPADNGGVELTGSQVQLGPSSAPGEYQGQVTQLAGTRLVANLTSTSGATLTATIDLQLSQAANSVSGTVRGAS
jgi:hypothetical protein